LSAKSLVLKLANKHSNVFGVVSANGQRTRRTPKELKRVNDRATEFRQRCDGLKISGVSLHSYRYAWAERALKCGYLRDVCAPTSQAGMQETANERLVREAAREVALEAMGRIRARLREVEAKPLAERLYVAEWGARGREWPPAAMPAWKWVSYLQEDLSLAEAEFEACRRT